MCHIEKGIVSYSMSMASMPQPSNSARYASERVSRVIHSYRICFHNYLRF